MSEQFDAFAPDQVAGNDSDGIYFGEIVLYRGFQGIWVRDEILAKSELQDYDPNNDAHKAAVAGGKKPYVYYSVQFFPTGVGFESRVDNLANFSDEWQELCKSLASLWGVDKIKSNEFSDKLRQWAGNSIFAKWQLEIVEYKDKGGIERKRYIKRVLELYPDLAAAEKAHDEHKGIDGVADTVPDGFKVEALPKEQAFLFIRTMATELAKSATLDLAALKAKYQEFPMLANSDITDDDLVAIIQEMDGVPF